MERLAVGTGAPAAYLPAAISENQPGALYSSQVSQGNTGLPLRDNIANNSHRWKTQLLRRQAAEIPVRLADLHAAYRGRWQIVLSAGDFLIFVTLS